MGKLFWIALIVIILIAVGVFGYIYYFYEKPIKEEAAKNITAPISISFVNNNKKVETPFVITINSFNRIESTSTLGGYSSVEIPINSSIVIENVNGSYYKSSMPLFVASTETKRLDIEVTRFGNLTINNTGNMELNNITMFLTSTGLFKNFKICYTWSTHIIKIDSPEVPSARSSEYDRCSNSLYTLDNSKMNFTLDISRFGVLDYRDFISFDFIDEANNKVNFNINNIYKR